MLLTITELTTVVTMWALKKIWGGAVYMVWGTPMSPEQMEIKQLRESIDEMKIINQERLKLEKERKFDDIKKLEKREKEIHNMHDSFRMDYMSQSCPTLINLKQ
jgi:predicted RNase H-like nuclease